MESPKMKIALEGLGATVGPTDGAARYLNGMAYGLSKQAQLDLLVLHGPSMQGAVDVPLRVRCQTLGGPRRGRRVMAQHHSVPRAAQAWGADAVVYTGNYCPIFKGPPSVVVVQNMLVINGTFDFGYAVGLYRRCQLSSIARKADRIVAVSQFLADAMLERFPGLGHKLKVIPSGVDERFFTEVDTDAEVEHERRWRERPYFLCVGTAWPYRDYELAMSALARSRLDHDLVIAGAAAAPDHERLMRHHNSCGMRGELVMAGCIDTEGLRIAYRDAAALVATSRTESFALSVLEAMAVGAPVVAVRRTVYPETVGDGGLLCEATVEDLATTLHAVTEPPVRDRLIRKGRERAARSRWSETAAKVVQLVDDLSPGGTRRSTPGQGGSGADRDAVAV